MSAGSLPFRLRGSGFRATSEMSKGLHEQLEGEGASEPMAISDNQLCLADEFRHDDRDSHA